MKSMVQVIWFKFEWRLLLAPNWKPSSTDPYLGLVLSRRQAIIRTIDGLITIFTCRDNHLKFEKPLRKNIVIVTNHGAIQLIFQHRNLHVQFVSHNIRVVLLSFLWFCYEFLVYMSDLFTDIPQGCYEFPSASDGVLKDVGVSTST